MKKYKILIKVGVILIIIDFILLYFALNTEVKWYKIFCAILSILNTFTAFIIGALCMEVESENKKEFKLTYPSDI